MEKQNEPVDTQEELLDESELSLDVELPFKQTRPRRFRELLDALGGYKVLEKKPRLDQF